MAQEDIGANTVHDNMIASEMGAINLREPVRNVPYKLNWTQPFAKDSGVGRALGMACDHAKKQN